MYMGWIAEKQEYENRKERKEEKLDTGTGEIIILRVITPVKIFSSFVKSDETDFTEASGNLF